jgi:hypothetical protein
VDKAEAAKEASLVLHFRQKQELPVTPTGGRIARAPRKEPATLPEQGKLL